MSISKSYLLVAQILIALGLSACQADAPKVGENESAIYTNYIDGRQIVFKNGAVIQQILSEQIPNMTQKISVHEMNTPKMSCISIGDSVEGLPNEFLVFAKLKNTRDGSSFECGGKRFTVSKCFNDPSECQSYLVSVNTGDNSHIDYKYIYDKCRGVVVYYSGNSFEHAYALEGFRGVLSENDGCGLK